MEIKNLKIKLNFGAITIEGDWQINEVSKKASWEMYVELITRISIVELKENEGLLREALNSLYSLFNITREILKKYGHKVCIPDNKNGITFGYLSIVILNELIRPILAKWHPLLLDYEGNRGKDTTVFEHERNWKHNKELRKELNELRKNLLKYSKTLEKALNINSLVIE